MRDLAKSLASLSNIHAKIAEDVMQNEVWQLRCQICGKKKPVTKKQFEIYSIVGWPNCCKSMILEKDTGISCQEAHGGSNVHAGCSYYI